MIDAIDRDIIGHLQSDGRLSHKQLGELVGLSPNATGVRVQRLLADGVITGIHAQVDNARLGRPLEAYIDCWLAGREVEDWSAFEAHVALDDRVLDVVHLTGKVDYRLRVVVASSEELDAFLTGLKGEGRIAETNTQLILRRYAAGGTRLRN